MKRGGQEKRSFSSTYQARDGSSFATRLTMLDQRATLDRRKDVQNPDRGRNSDRDIGADREQAVARSNAFGSAKPSPPPSPMVDLSVVAGVHQSDSEAESNVLAHSILARAVPRVAFSPQSALAAILVLVCALAASLTLLLIQGHNMSAALAAVSSPAQSASSADSADQRGVDSRGSAATESAVGGGNAARGGALAGADGETQSSSGASAAGGQSVSGSAAGSAASPSAAQQAATQANAAVIDGKININVASAEQLTTVKGIGPSTAQKIIDYRNQHGRFSSVSALMNVSGIGEKKLAQMQPYVTVG